MSRRIRALQALGTLAHNRQFTRNEAAECSDALYEELDAMVRDRLVERVARGTFFPTPLGWEAIAKAS